MRREDLLKLFLGFLVVVIHGTAPFLDTEGFVSTTVERSTLGFPGGHEREGSLDRLNPQYMEVEATYTAARSVVTALVGGRRLKGQVSRPGRKAAPLTV